MSENTQLQVSTGTGLLPSAPQWQMIQSIASAVATANNLSPAKMANILLWGNALGLTIPASIELIQNVQGKTSLAPRGAWALVQNSPAWSMLKMHLSGMSAIFGARMVLSLPGAGRWKTRSGPG